MDPSDAMTGTGLSISTCALDLAAPRVAVRASAATTQVVRGVIRRA
ncbi:hypothetical protein [Micromonospora sp. NPDC005220]